MASRRPAGWLALVALGGALGALAAAAAGPPEERAALPSDRASTSLLLDAARAGGRVVAVGTRGHVVLRDGREAPWRQASSVPTRTTLTGVFFANPREGWAVGHDAVVLHTGDGGETWALQHFGPELESPLLSVWFADARRGIAVGGYGLILHTYDGGVHWERRALAGGDDPHLNEIFEAPDGTLYLAAEAGAVYRSDDGGNGWKRLETPYPGSFWSGLALRDGAVLVFGMRGHVLRSEDRGESWRELDSGTDLSLAGGAELEGARVVIGGLGGTLLRSSDGGLSFSASSRPDRKDISAILADADQGLLLFGAFGADVAAASQNAEPLNP